MVSTEGHILWLGLQQLQGYYAINGGVFEGVKVTQIELNQDGYWNYGYYQAAGGITWYIQYQEFGLQYTTKFLGRLTFTENRTEKSARLMFETYHGLSAVGTALLKVILEMGQLAFDAEQGAEVEQNARKLEEEEEWIRQDLLRKMTKAMESWILGEDKIGVEHDRG